MRYADDQSMVAGTKEGIPYIKTAFNEVEENIIWESI